MKANEHAKSYDHAHDRVWLGRGSHAARLSRLFAASPPLLVAALVGKLWLSGTIGYFVNARTAWIVLVGCVLFGVVGIALLQHAWSHASDSGPSWHTFVFLLPLVLGLALPAHPLSATTGQAASLGSLQLASHVSSDNPGDAFGLWVGELAQHPEPVWWRGQRVTLVGFVSRQVRLPGHTFIVARFMVTCCVVDASLIGFPVRLAHDPVPSDGSWVQVTGAFSGATWTDPGGVHWPVIGQARVMRATVPGNPYLSPS